ncbi:hypothetical protein J5690_00645 [bacterium]|nr:hypothetical protein [bacterium]
MSKLKIFQNAAEKIAECEHEVSNGGKLTIDIDEFGFLCHTVKFSARKQANDTLELELLNNPIQNIELVQNESKSVNVCGKQPWKFTYINQDSLRIEKGKNVSVTVEIESSLVAFREKEKNKCDIKINIDSYGKLVTVEKDTDTHSIKITTEKMPDDNLKLSLKNKIIAELIPNEPKDFEILDNKLGCSLYFNGCYIITSESKHPKLKITQRPLEIPLKDAVTTFVINPNGSGSLQMPTIHSIEFEVQVTQVDGRDALILNNGNGECRLSTESTKQFDVFDEILSRELYFSLKYYKKGNRHYLGVTQGLFKTNSESLYTIKRNGEGELCIKIGKSGKLIGENDTSNSADKEHHFVRITINKKNDSLTIRNHGNEIELRSDSSQNNKKIDIWDENLNRVIPLTFIYINN